MNSRGQAIFGDFLMIGGAVLVAAIVIGLVITNTTNQSTKIENEVYKESNFCPTDSMISQKDRTYCIIDNQLVEYVCNYYKTRCAWVGDGS